jgi:hypothetical protein
MHVANTEKRIAFKEVEVREKGSLRPSETVAQPTAKKRQPQTMEQVVGNEGVNDSSFTRGRGGRRGRGGGKSKGKQRADTEANEDAAAELSLSHTQSE